MNEKKLIDKIKKRTINGKANTVKGYFLWSHLKYKLYHFPA